MYKLQGWYRLNIDSCTHTGNIKGVREKWALSPKGSWYKMEEGEISIMSLGNDGSHGQWTMIFFGIRDFSQSTILKGPFVSGIAGSKPVSLLSLTPCSSPFMASSFLFHPLLLLTSSYSAHSAFFNTRHLWRQMILGFKLSELRRKKVSQASMFVQMAALLLRACVCSCVHVCMYVYGHMFTCRCV